MLLSDNQPFLHFLDMEPRAEMGLLLFQVESRICALPVSSVGETMRPLPVAPIPKTPDFVLGAALVRGVPIPIVCTGALLSGTPCADGRRWITVRAAADRWVGLQVSAVIGVFPVESFELNRLPPLLDGSGAVEKLGRHDRELLAVLDPGRVVPADVFARISELPED